MTSAAFTRVAKSIAAARPTVAAASRPNRRVAARRSHLAENTNSSALGSLVSRRFLSSFLIVALCTARGTSAQAGECEMNTSSSGLQWCDLVEGTGAAPVKGAKIEAHYIGKLTNGKKFDASYDRGQPLAFQVGVGQVIKGWDMGIVGTDDIPPMKVGGKRKLLIPPELGYGARGAGGVIPGGATLDFEVELVKA